MCASALISEVSSSEASQTTRSRLAARIGGISLGLTAESPDLNLVSDAALRNFLVTDSRCDMEFGVCWRDRLEEAHGELLFDSAGLWQLFDDSPGYCLRFTTAHLGPHPYKQMHVSHEFTRGSIELRRSLFPQGRPVNALEYPLDELLWIHRLAQGEGVEVHACGVVAPDGRGFLLAGHSGAGKSTSARLWAEHSGARVLSDDRIILRRENGRVRMYGTPWHGDAGIAEAASCPLDAILVLAHADSNLLRPLGPAAVSAELYVRSFVPHHSPDGVSFVLGFFDRLTREVPCYEFSFVPDFSAVEALLHEKF